MWCLLALGACLIAKSSSTAANLNKVNFEPDLEFNATKSATVAFDSRYNGPGIYTITLNDTHMHINGTLTNPVKIDKSLALDPKDRIAGRISAVAGGDVIVVYGVNSTEIANESRRTRYTVLLFDPFLSPFAYRSMSIPVDEVPLSYPSSLPLIMAYRDDIDVFLPSLRGCAPCHYNATGYMTKSKNQLQPQDAPPARAYHLVGTRLGAFERPWLFAYNYANGSAVLKYLNFEYGDYYGSVFGRSIAPRLFDHAIDALIANTPNFADNAYTTFCYGSQEVRCTQYDGDMRLRYNETVPLLEDHYGHRISLAISYDGRSYAGVIQSPKQQDKPHRRTLYVFSNKGELTKSFDFGEIDKKYRHIELDMWYVGDYFCLHTSEREKVDAIDAREDVKCIEYKEIRD